MIRKKLSTDTYAAQNKCTNFPMQFPVHTLFFCITQQEEKHVGAMGKKIAEL